LIGGLAVNCYVEPVYTLDADFVVIAPSLAGLAAHLESQGFQIDRHPHSVNARAPQGKRRIQFITEPRYQAFLSRAVEAEVLGRPVKVACLADVTQGKLWAYGDPSRRLSQPKKDELDLIRLAEVHPELMASYPAELRAQIERG